ncbi:MAG: penicillin-binding protein, partial [Oscillospiraceae bacterium]|nr:penicillin-binding protein [Oscillospiraceae bacterium]
MTFTKKVKAFFKHPGVRIPLRIFSALIKFLLTVFLIAIITVSIVGMVMAVYVINNFSGSSGADKIELDKININQTSIMYVQDDSGNWVEDFRLDGLTNSIWAPLEDIPMNLQNAVIAIEDERFREHAGVDWRRTISAFANMVIGFSKTDFGGSTITQQLIKTVTGEDDHKIERKIEEIMRAIYLERNVYTKEEILEAYLNVLPLSGKIVGVGAAANEYFGVEVQHLSLAQCAAIASITQNPSRFNPYGHPENLRNRQQTVLSKMHELEFITDDEYIQAANEELRFYNNTRKVKVQDYYADMVVEDVVNDLMREFGYNKGMAEQMLFHGGLHIYSYENRAVQAKVEAIYADDNNFPDAIAGDKEEPQGALFIMDYSGRVIATAGGRGVKEGNRTFNRSTMSSRQPGSAIKPLSSYGPAMEWNLINYSSLELDGPITVNGKAWPPNYGNTTAFTRGNVTVEYALKKSLNTVAAQLVQKLTLERSYNFLSETLMLTSLDEVQDRAYAPLALGGFTYGVKCREMAAAFATFGNGGKWYAPASYERVEQGGGILLDNRNPLPIQAFSPNTAYIMNRLLQKVMTEGTAQASLASYWRGWEVYCKTGTSGGVSSATERNVYLLAGTPEYVAASWFGYDHNKGLNRSQVNYAKTLWNKCLLELRNDGLADKTFNSFKADTVE